METVNIEGREVNFEIEQTNFPQLLNFAKNALLSACKGNKIFSYFKQITFVFKDEYDQKEINMDLIRAFREDHIGGGSHVSPHDIVKRLNRIYIALDSLIASVEDIHLSMWGIVPISDRRFIREAYKQLYNSAVHEAAHLWHINKNIALNRLPKVIARLEKSVGKLNEELRKYGGSERIASLLILLKGYVNAFTSNILLEGLALYFEKIEKYSISKEHFDALHSVAKRTINETMIYLANAIATFRRVVSEHRAILRESDIITIRESYEPLRSAPYGVGIHMLYTLLYTEPTMNIEKIAGFNFAEFIVIYERCCAKLGIRPLVSLTSRRGIFDYKRVLRDLERLEILIKRLNL
ncbi:MAG: hypothetical protein AABX63_00200 [Nanoarchaeota archaeon]